MVQTIVLGAGMVGVSTALALQARGDDVILVDRRGIGRETSYGNAGAIQTEAVEPYPFPRSIPKLIDVALKRTNDVNWHLSSLPEHAGVLWNYWKNSSPVGHARASQTYSQLVGKSDLYHAPLIEAAGADHLIERRGYRCVFRTDRALDAALGDAARIEGAFGVPFATETGETLAAAEPGLRRGLAGAIHYGAVWTCLSPGGLTAAYGRLFAAQGGRFVYGDAQSLAQGGAGWSVQTEDGLHTAERAVLALGPWSTQVTARFDYRIPLFRKRGYHRHFHAAQGPRSCMFDAERGVFLARMNQGLRLTTGAEFTRMDAPVNWLQIRRAERSTRELFDLGPALEADPWFGHRPCLPDMLPVVGEAPRHPGLWFHFGHAHQGFTAGPASAHILAEMMSGHSHPLARALAPGRFD